MEFLGALLQREEFGIGIVVVILAIAIIFVVWSMSKISSAYSKADERSDKFNELMLESMQKTTAQFTQVSHTNSELKIAIGALAVSIDQSQATSTQDSGAIATALNALTNTLNHQTKSLQAIPPALEAVRDDTAATRQAVEDQGQTTSDDLHQVKISLEKLTGRIEDLLTEMNTGNEALVIGVNQLTHAIRQWRGDANHMIDLILAKGVLDDDEDEASDNGSAGGSAAGGGDAGDGAGTRGGIATGDAGAGLVYQPGTVRDDGHAVDGDRGRTGGRVNDTGVGDDGEDREGSAAGNIT